MLVVEENGSKIVGLFLVEKESEEVISSIVNKFKDKNEAWSKTVVVMLIKTLQTAKILVPVFPMLSCWYVFILLYAASEERSYVKNAHVISRTQLRVRNNTAYRLRKKWRSLWSKSKTFAKRGITYCSWLLYGKFGTLLKSNGWSFIKVKALISEKPLITDYNLHLGTLKAFAPNIQV